MDLPSSWTDPSTILGGGGLLAGIGAVVKTLLDWRKDRGSERISAEDAIRDDFQVEFQAQREEITRLRQELAAARQEIRAFQDVHQKAMTEWQERYGRLFVELAELRAALQQYKRSADHD